MKKALMAALIILAPCKSTNSIHQYAKSAGAGIAEIGLLVNEPAPESMNNRQNDKKDISISKLVWSTLIDYFRLLQPLPVRKFLIDCARDLMNSLDLIQTGRLGFKDSSDEILSSVRNFLITIFKENIKRHCYKQLVRIMKENDSALSFLVDQCDAILDSSKDVQFWILTSKNILKLVRKDHYMLIFGKPPIGFAYTSMEVSQDIILINKMTATLRSFHPDANE